MRQRLANLGTMLVVWAKEGFAAQDPEVRASRYRHIRGDDVIAKLSGSFWAGYASLPQDLTAVDVAARLASLKPAGAADTRSRQTASAKCGRRPAGVVVAGLRWRAAQATFPHSMSVLR